MTDPAPLVAGLAGQYRIERELGAGGFATVFLAHDLRHDRPVALKVLHPEIAASLGNDRFKQEIRVAARLQHPHILGVLDSGAVDHRIWFTMPFIEGESLRQRLTREQQLPIDDAIRIVREVADALDYAHSHGVIHRDVKPENILLSAGHALLADFGIARALGGAALTQTGVSVGTPAYMSPEQASNAGTVDARTDIYSLGCVLYESLAGEPPFTGPSTQSILARVLTETPRPLRATRPSVSAALEDVCLKAIARVPADRYATAAEFAAALVSATAETRTPSLASEPLLRTESAPAAPRSRDYRWPLAAALGVLVIAAVAGVLWWRQSGTESDTRRLAVLPFENLGAREDEYFADGITDEIRGKLAALPGLQVTARSSAAQYKSVSNKTPQQIGEELGVDFLLSGTVRWEAGQAQNRRVRVSPELVQAVTGTTEWQQPFDTEMSDIFTMQAQIASRVAEALDVALGTDVKERLAERPTTNLAAYDAFLRGEALSQSVTVTDPVPVRRAIGFYQQAVALDPRFVMAWAQLGRAACQLGFSNVAADLEICRRSAERAMTEGGTRPESRLAMGRYLEVGPREFEKALEQFTHGLQHAPNHTGLLAASGSVERRLGRFDDALAHVERAARLDPRSVEAAVQLARTYHALHRFKEADVEYARALALAPNNLRLVQFRVGNHLSQGDLAAARGVIAAALQHVGVKDVLVRFATYQEMMWVLPDDLRSQIVHLQPADFDNDRGMWALKVGATYLLMGDARRAQEYGRISAAEYQKLLKSLPNDAQRLELLGRALALAGQKEEAIAAGERSLARRETQVDAVSGPYYKYQVARIYIQVGEHQRALDLIEPLPSSPGEITAGWLRIDPVFTPLRGNPRFERLTKD